jgi:hypothetical protein
LWLTVAEQLLFWPPSARLPQAPLHVENWWLEAVAVIMAMIYDGKGRDSNFLESRSMLFVAATAF